MPHDKLSLATLFTVVGETQEVEGCDFFAIFFVGLSSVLFEFNDARFLFREIKLKFRESRF